MEIENLNILKNKITTILDESLINDFKKINTSTIPKRLFSVDLMRDIEYIDYDEKELKELLNQFDLDERILARNYNSISKSEYKKITISKDTLTEVKSTPYYSIETLKRRMNIQHIFENCESLVSIDLFKTITS